MADKSTQTTLPKVFTITRPVVDPHRYATLECSLYTPLAKEAKFMSIENLIIDTLICHHDQQGDPRLDAFILKDPCEVFNMFSWINGRLQCNLSVRIEVMRNRLISPNSPPIVEMFEQAMVAIWNKRNEFLDKFGQCKFRTDSNLIEGLAVFTIFLSKYLKREYVSFISEFLLVVLHLAFQLHHSHSNVQRLILRQTSEHKTLVAKSRRLMIAVFGKGTNFKLECGIVFRVFREYLASNGFLAISDQ
jgi:hypothetical protein